MLAINARRAILSIPSTTTYNYLLDQFTDSDGVLLSAHTADTMQSWTAQSNNFDVASNQVRGKGTTTGDVCIATVESSLGADVTVEIKFTRNSSSARAVAIVGRYTDNSNYWRIQNTGSGNGFQIHEINAGTDTLRAFGNPTVPTGTEKTLRVVFSGNTITATIDATTIQYTSATFNNTATKFGIYGVYESVANQRDVINYLLLWQGSASPPANPIYPFP